MQKFISGKPNLELKYFLPIKKEGYTVFPLKHPRCSYHFSARYALAQAIKVLGLKCGNKLLIPSYNCGSEIDPILNLNIEPVFYRIKKNLMLDYDDLVGKIDENVKAIMVIHYLGFPQPVEKIKKLCRKKNLILIEDCAHALLSDYLGKPLGCFGDVAFFSIMKTLPVPNGGVLVINDANFESPADMEAPSFFSTLFYSAQLLKLRTSKKKNNLKEYLVYGLNNGISILSDATRYSMLVLRKIFNTNRYSFLRPDSHLFIDEISKWGMSLLSRNIITNVDFKEIKDLRRRNYEYLLNHFLRQCKITLPFDSLPVGVCPLFFPILMEHAEQREAVHKTLLKRGVVSHDWWKRFHPSVPWGAFPDAVYLKERLFGLPIHQDLKIDDLDEVIEAFEKTYRETLR